MLSARHPARAPCQTCTSQEQGARHVRAHGSGSNIVLLMRRTITHGFMAWSLSMALGFTQQFNNPDRRHTCTTASVFAHFRQVFANFPQSGFFDRCLLRYCKHGVSSRTGNTRITKALETTMYKRAHRLKNTTGRYRHIKSFPKQGSQESFVDSTCVPPRPFQNQDPFFTHQQLQKGSRSSCRKIASSR